MPLFTSLIVIFVFTVSLGTAAAPVDQNASTQDMDTSVKPGDDFYRYANGGWLRTATIPAGQSSYDTRAMLVEKTSQRVRDLIRDAAAAQPIRGSMAQKVGDYYASFMGGWHRGQGADTIGRRNGQDLSDHQQSVAVSLSRHHLEY
jgi:predicted metalloendopeptidase